MIGDAGFGGLGNQFQILNGAQMLSNTSVILGLGTSSNTLVVAGANSLLMNSGSFQMVSTPGHQLIVSNGAQFTCSGATVDGSNRVVTITGSNTVWSNSGSLQFGRHGSNNVLSISDGAAVSNRDAYIGTNSSGNRVVISGAKSIWNTASVTIGIGTSGNQLIISNGAALDSGSMTIGLEGPGNALILTGSNTVCNGGTVVVGLSAGGNAKFNVLSIQDGARLSLNNSSATISAGGFGNQVVVTGPGSQWTGINALTVGPSDMMCQFTISNGATVQAAQMVVGKIFNGSSNQVSILNGGTLIVTNGSGTAPLILTQTATITLNAGTLIGNSILISNLCRITGCGTIVGNIKNLGTLAINCPGGTLTILGAVTNYATILATNDADVEFLGPVVNNGTIDVINGWAHFQGGLINQGVYRDAGSVLRITSFNANGGDIAFGFLTVSNKSYAVEYTDDLIAGTWLVLTNITGSGVATQIVDPGAAVFTQRFYRVHLSLP
jgi:T5SS/PEP-CTERM-associated repeat protein